MEKRAVLLVVVGVLISAISLSGCSVGMALSGKKDVDVAALRVGQPREEVIMIVGQPMKTMTTETGRMDIFECQKGNAPSTGRAVGHAVMDVLTWGAWEIIGTPVEALGSSKYYITIQYDKQDRVTNIKAGDTSEGLDLGLQASLKMLDKPKDCSGYAFWKC